MAKPRSQKMNEELLKQYNLPKSFIWNAFPEAFEKLFRSPNGIDEDHVDDEAERLNCLPNGELNWDWYVPYRLNSKKITSKYSSEEKIYSNLFSDDPKRLIYLHGHTGCGKSTLIRFFFTHYLSKIKKLSDERLSKMVTVKIPLSFFNIDALEAEWDDRVTNFLYKEFSELEDEKFIKNLARFIAYPIDNKNRFLRMNEHGILEAVGHASRFSKDIEQKVASLKSIDAVSVWKWINSTFKIVKNLTIGSGFNKKIIQLLAKHYKYEFFFVVDNIDDIPESIQFEICRLVNSKMRAYTPYPLIKFIIATRDNFIEPIMSETLPIARQFHQNLEALDPLPFGEVLRARKRTLFDPMITSKSQMINISKSISMTVNHIDKFLIYVFRAFDNHEKLTDLYMLSNHSTRRMLDIVKSLLESPHYERELKYEIAISSTSDGKEIRKNTAMNMISIDRLIDSIVRGTNRLVAIRSRSYLPCLFCSSKANHFSSTLCRMFILSIINNEDSISFYDLFNMLKELGHKSVTIDKSIQDLLKMQLIFSTKGFYIPSDIQKRNQMLLEEGELLFGQYLLYDLSCSLRYFQAMGYVTPLEPKYSELIIISEEIGNSIDDFSDRMTSAKALYNQILYDFIKQRNFVENIEDQEYKKRMFRVIERYSLFEIIEHIRVNLTRELYRIIKKNPDMKEGLEIEKIFPKFLYHLKM